MDDRNQQSSGFTSANPPPTSTNFGSGRASFDPEALSGSPISPAVTPPAQKGDNFWVRLVKRADAILAILLVLAGAGLFLIVSQNDGKSPPESPAGRFNTVNVPLEDFVEGETINFGDQQVLINGSLQANGDFVLTPSEQPTDAATGQIYYDQTSNVLAYYNGTEFVSVANAEGVVQSVGGQTGEVTLTAGSGIAITGTTIANTGVISVASGSPNIIVETDADGNATVSSTTTGTGTVSSPGGTAGTIPVFTGAQSIANSLLSQSGGTVTIGGNASVTGNLTVSGTATLDTPLSVSNGGTGAASLANNGVLVGHGTSPVTSVTGAEGQCLQIVGGAPTFAACPGGGGGVDSLNTLTGALTVQGTANRITVSDNGSDTITLSTPQDIATTSSPTFANLTLSGDLAVNGQDISSTGALTITNSAGNLTLNTAGTIELQDGTNITGNLGISGTLASGTASVSNGSLTLQNATNAFGVTLNAPNQTAGSATVSLPDTGGVNDTVCLQSLGNCVGTGGGVTTAGGTAGRLAVFSGAQSIGDSSITDSGGVVTLNGATDMVIQGGGITLGTAAQAGSILLHDGDGETVTFAMPDVGASYTLTLPTSVGTADQCLKAQNGTGTLFWDGCLGGGGITSVDGQTGPAITINNATGAANAITIDDAAADGTTKGIATFNATNFSAAGGVVNTIQGISTTASPQFAGLTLTGNLNLGANTLQGTTAVIDFTNFDVASNGNTTIGGTLSVQGASATVGGAALAGSLVLNDGSSNTLTLQAGAFGANRVYTFPDVGSNANVCLDTGNCAGAGNGITGSGTADTLAKFTAGGVIGDSSIVDDGTTVTVGTLVSPVGVEISGALDVYGDITDPGGTLTLADATSVTGTINVSGVATLQSTLTVQGGAATLGTTAQQGSLVLHDGNGQTATISVGSALAANTALAIPTGVGASDTFCLQTLANCGGGGDSISVNGSAATDANFLNTAASGTEAAVTWSLNTGATPDAISISIGSASATTAGTITTGSQTIAGAKTLTGATTVQLDSATALRVLNSAGTVAVLSVDTSTPGIVISGSGTDGSGGVLTFGSGGSAPFITREAAAFFGPDPDVLTFETTAMQVTNSGSTLYDMEGFNGRFVYRMANDSFGYFQFRDSTDDFLFDINGQNGTGEATFKSRTDSTLAFRVLNAAGGSQFTIDTSNDQIDIDTAGFYLNNIGTVPGSQNVLCIDSSTRQVRMSGTTTDCSTSSARFKDNITSLSEEMGLEVINSLRPVTFTYKNGDGSTKIGLIAEEVAQVLPEVVAYDEQGLPAGINYEYMVANLIKAIQQQQVQIAALQQGVLNGALVEITGHIRVGKDTAGTVVIPAGQTSVHVAFDQSYETAPVVTTGVHDFVMVRLLNTTTAGFTLAIPGPADHDIRVNWTALEAVSTD